VGRTLSVSAQTSTIDKAMQASTGGPRSTTQPSALAASVRLCATGERRHRGHETSGEPDEHQQAEHEDEVIPSGQDVLDPEQGVGLGDLEGGARITGSAEQADPGHRVGQRADVGLTADPGHPEQHGGVRAPHALNLDHPGQSALAAADGLPAGGALLGPAHGEILGHRLALGRRAPAPQEIARCHFLHEQVDHRRFVGHGRSAERQRGREDRGQAGEARGQAGDDRPRFDPDHRSSPRRTIRYLRQSSRIARLGHLPHRLFLPVAHHLGPQGSVVAGVARLDRLQLDDALTGRRGQQHPFPGFRTFQGIGELLAVGLLDAAPGPVLEHIEAAVDLGVGLPVVQELDECLQTGPRLDRHRARPPGNPVAAVRQ
jgi:hypothetical protein